MPIALPPQECRCQDCGYRRSYRSRSDALLGDEVAPSSCPKCGSVNWRCKEMGKLSEVLRRIVLGKRTGSTT